MRYWDDDNLSFCLTISSGIKQGDLLNILGKMEVLAEPRAFDNFVWDPHQAGKTGLLNFFKYGDLLVTIENNGLLGVSHRTIKHITSLTDEIYHYVAIYFSSGNGDSQYVEIQDGTVVANFDPLLDEPSVAVSDFFAKGDNQQTIRHAMIRAIEYRMETSVLEDWLTQPTETYFIDYRTQDRML